jgi:hypothetical protein
MAAALVAVAGVFLSLYALHPSGVPVGYDTPKYVWRARLVAALGMKALLAVPHGVSVTADRPGYPVAVDLWSAALGASPLHIAMALPAAVAATVGAGAAAFARACLERPRWLAPVFAVAVGASPLVALMARGHADNLLLSVLAIGAAASVLLAAGGGRTVAASALLLGAGAAVHWNFDAFLAAILVALALALLPESLGARRAGAPWRGTASVRIAVAVALGAAIGGVVLALTPVAPGLPGLSRGAFLSKLRLDLPSVVPAVVVPLAALGAVALALEGSGRRGPRRALVLLVLWALTAAAAVAALELGAAAPAHRVLEFALAIPMLAAAGVLWLARRAWGPERGASSIRRGTAIAMVAGALAATLAASHGVWSSNGPSIDAVTLGQIRTAARYVDGLPDGRPALFLVDTGSRRPDVDAVLADHWIRLSVSPERIPLTAVYVGDMDNLDAGRPTVRAGNARFDRASRRFWAGDRSLLGRRPAVIVLSALDRSSARLAGSRPGAEVAPGVAVIRGPVPQGGVPPAPPPARVPVAVLALLGAGLVAMAAAVGSGWAVAVLPSGVRLALAPALGIAVLVLAGTMADRAGVRLDGIPAIAVAAGAAAVGWCLAATGPRRGRAARRTVVGFGRRFGGSRGGTFRT